MILYAIITLLVVIIALTALYFVEKSRLNEAKKQIVAIKENLDLQTEINNTIKTMGKISQKHSEKIQKAAQESLKNKKETEAMNYEKLSEVMQKEFKKRNEGK